jgi:hypothetical protein
VRSGQLRDAQNPLEVLAGATSMAGAKTADTHAYCEVLTLNNRSADAIRIGSADNRDHLNGFNSCPRVAAFTFGRSSVNLDELRESSLSPLAQKKLTTNTGGRALCSGILASPSHSSMFRRFCDLCLGSKPIVLARIVSPPRQVS